MTSIAREQESFPVASILLENNVRCQMSDVRCQKSDVRCPPRWLWRGWGCWRCWLSRWSSPGRQTAGHPHQTAVSSRMDTRIIMTSLSPKFRISESDWGPRICSCSRSTSNHSTLTLYIKRSECTLTFKCWRCTESYFQIVIVLFEHNLVFLTSNV